MRGMRASMSPVVARPSRRATPDRRPAQAFGSSVHGGVGSGSGCGAGGTVPGGSPGIGWGSGGIGSVGGFGGLGSDSGCAMAGPYPRPSPGEPARTASGSAGVGGHGWHGLARGTKVDARGGPTLPPNRRSDVRAFECPVCRQLVFFENNQCLRCRALLGFEPRAREIVALDRGPQTWARCANFEIAGCNWLLAEDDPGPLCVSLPAHPHPARRRRRRGPGGVPGDRGGQAPAGLPAARAGSPRRPEERLPGLGPGLRPALEPLPARRHRPRRRRGHARPLGVRRCLPGAGPP